ncbi:MAG: glycosyltransferase family 1 protein, partial [Jaaginema sp. PMC 1079.18]|nr:glycosyltransferase family 1 protein [Jaaginema sp. PMC 1079.18]
IQGIGGVARYFSNLISQLPPNYKPALAVNQNPAAIYPSHPNLKIFQYNYLGLQPSRISAWFEPYYFQWFTQHNQVDLWHLTYYQILTQTPLKRIKCPWVITIHDMIHELFSKQIDPDGKQAAAKKEAILGCDAIFCVSENTKRDLLHYYPSVADKVFVTYLGAENPAQSSFDSQDFVTTESYYLYVGGRWFYKNFGGLITAFAKVSTLLPNVKLYVVGQAFNQEEHKQIAELNLTDKITVFSQITDRDLAALYRNSLALVYPSLYEGFGLPPLEAMVNGTPVITSKCSSIPEVVGDAGILIDPRSSHDLAEALLLIYNHPLERERLRAQGYKRAKLFSWERLTEKTLKVYKSLV